MPLPNPKDGVGEVPPFGPPNPPVGMDAKRLGRALPEFAARAAAPLAPRFFSGAILRLLAVARRLFLKKRRGGKGGGGGEKRREKKEKEKRKKERKKRKKKERTERKKKKEEKKKTVKKKVGSYLRVAKVEGSACLLGSMLSSGPPPPPPPAVKLKFMPSFVSWISAGRFVIDGKEPVLDARQREPPGCAWLPTCRQRACVARTCLRGD